MHQFAVSLKMLNGSPLCYCQIIPRPHNFMAGLFYKTSCAREQSIVLACINLSSLMVHLSITSRFQDKIV